MPILELIYLLFKNPGIIAGIAIGVITGFVGSLFIWGEPNSILIGSFAIVFMAVGSILDEKYWKRDKSE